MNKYSILFRIGAIIFVVEGLIMIGFSFFDPITSPMVAAIVDASLLTLLSAPPIYFLVIKPYMEERVDMLFGVQELFDNKETNNEEGSSQS